MARRRQQVFNPGELPLVLLALLREQRTSGYGLLQLLGDRLAADYRPSPGSVYPAISALRAGGLVESDDTLGSGALRITADGAAVLDLKAPLLADIERRLSTRFSTSTTPVDAADGDGAAIHAELDRFNQRVRAAAATSAAAIRPILDAAAEAIERLGDTDGRAAPTHR